MSANAWKRLHNFGSIELEAWRKAAADPGVFQQGLLNEILTANASSSFGREHEFKAIRDLDRFRARVPVRDFAAIKPWIDRIRRGERNALTAAEPIAFEETGGSSGGRKLIATTPPGLAAFRRAVLAWLADLLDSDPEIANGCAYFATSPATRMERRIECGLPVGLESDAAYFGENLLLDVAAVTIGDATLASIFDFGDWRRRTLTLLVAADDLTLISVWSPTFLTALVEALDHDPDPILRALQDGKMLPASPQRARALARSVASGKLDTAVLWPQLRLISAWGDAGSARFVDALRTRFPKVRFQPKGLLATEGAFTVPLHDASAPVPALTSTFLEFEAEDGSLHLVDDLDPGADYRLIVTTPGGFYRYRIGDVVRCVGFYPSDAFSVPMLSFQGRAANTLNLVGEKLEEGFVADCLARSARGFAALVPMTDAPLRYLLILDQKAGNDLATVASAVEESLARNPLYTDARRNGELGPLQAISLTRPVDVYCETRVRAGARLGDIKLPVTFANIEAASAVWPELAHLVRHGSVGNC